MMTTVSLKGAEFFAQHGYYPEEQVLGTTFIVEVDVTFDAGDESSSDELDKTVNYEYIYHLCCEEMKKPRKLLETVANTIIQQIQQRYSFAEEIIVTIKKKHPPFKGKVDHSAVTMRYIKP
ncbi:dihydroneopterin aldolase [Mucilaginibacter limnophilus]|uniref:7,8-dihydroneopterin aldolase n=1 Tax=Mucilaginibacter limnophilus TaxID=1932778 RepID=A0A3S2UKS2_9SPHI|nr:dihydroneopterin aldolase [Mucilaginibacter limnophilus]RVU00599.1 dihydroneopterin aldolase [Mucilaginibacter limnophilus]